MPLLSFTDEDQWNFIVTSGISCSSKKKKGGGGGEGEQGGKGISDLLIESDILLHLSVEDEQGHSHHQQNQTFCYLYFCLNSFGKFVDIDVQFTMCIIKSHLDPVCPCPRKSVHRVCWDSVITACVPVLVGVCVYFNKFSKCYVLRRKSKLCSLIHGGSCTV